jgi:alkanesulfonate monooxygenase SsuD/methylene tetrahydromethanopterin reductase-like flavin-dependent oxidoreductase (luciferase family)
VLGASENSARLAAGHGLPFAYGHHLSRTVCRPQAAARYRSEYRPGRSGTQPYLIVSVQVVCADTDTQAEALALRTASYIVAHSGDGAPSAPLSPAREEYLARQSLEEYQVVHGGPATVNTRLEALAAEFGADELMVVPYELTGAARCRTLHLTAGARRAPAPERRARG